MEKIYKKFLSQSYLRTNGFTPVLPNTEQVLPGDFFQIKNGHIAILGNIFKDQILDPKNIFLQYDIHQNPENWDISEGVQKPFFGKKHTHIESGEEEKDVKSFRFESPGSFFFKGKEPKSVKIKNWDHIQDQLTIKLTQVQYSFREVFVAYESAYLDEWILAVANDFDGKLELSVKVKENGVFDVFGPVESRAVQAKHIECYLRGSKTSLPFFKAKKLCMRDERNRLASVDAIRNENAIVGWANDFFDFEFHVEDDHRNPRYTEISLIDKLRAHELNPTTALEFFQWTDFNLDDIETLFS